jgi:two-component system sensor histidine kinase KdpD
MTLAQSREENKERFAVSVPNDVRFNVDADLIRRALAQILENAQKYAPPDSPIEIAAAAEDGQLVISVSDRGPGISKDELERVFEKFYRGRQVKGKIEGTGMGLAIAKGIIEAHGGRIRASNRLGGGATIAITLPRDAGKP